MLRRPYFNAYFRAPRAVPKYFGVVSAYNPRGRKVPPAVNRRRDAALRQRLRSMRARFFRVTGGSADGSHREPGFGLSAPRETVRALASLFEQDAYFWIASDRVYLVSAEGGPLKRAGSWRARRASW